LIIQSGNLGVGILAIAICG